MKRAILIASDPKSGDEALGRVFNGLALAAECQRNHDEVAVLFIGAGTRWPAALSQPGHPVRELYNSIRSSVQGASCACASVFGAGDDVAACGLPQLKDNPLPGTPGLASLRRYLADGWQTLVF